MLLRFSWGSFSFLESPNSASCSQSLPLTREVPSNSEAEGLYRKGLRFHRKLMRKGKSYRTIPQSRLRRASSLYTREPPPTASPTGKPLCLLLGRRWSEGPDEGNLQSSNSASCSQSLPLTREVAFAQQRSEGETPLQTSLPQSAAPTAPSSEGAFSIGAQVPLLSCV